MSKMVWTGDKIDKAAAWQYAEIKRRVGTSKVVENYDVQDEYNSILGMMAFAVRFNLPLVLLSPDEPSDYGEDFKVNGFTIDVKTTIHPNGKLVHRWGQRYRYDADVYVLSIVNRESVRLAGWAWHDELLRGKVMDWGNRGKPCKTLAQSELHPMESLSSELLFERILAAA